MLLIRLSSTLTQNTRAHTYHNTKRDLITLPVGIRQSKVQGVNGLKFSLAARPRGHKQRKRNEHVYSFLLSVPSKPHYQAEF